MRAVIAFVSGKGGTGKSTSVYAMAYSLAWSGCKVVLVDLDPTAALTEWATHTFPPAEGALPPMPPSLIDDAPVRLGAPFGAPFGDAGETVADVFLLRGHRTLSNTSLADYRVRMQQAADLVGEEGVVLVDCPGVLGKELPAVAEQRGAQFLLVVEARATSSRKATDLVRGLRHNFPEVPLAMLVTKLGRDAESRTTQAELAAQFPDLLLPSAIPQDTWVSHAEREMVPVTARRASAAHKAYAEATEQLVERILMRYAPTFAEVA